MPRKARKPPKSPALIAQEKLVQRARDFEAVAMPAEAATLASYADVQVDRATRQTSKERGNVDRAKRMDVFDALREGMAAGSYDAARRLERDILIRRGEHDHGRPLDRVDGALISAFGRNDQIIAAGERVDAVMARLGEREGWLLLELVVPALTRPAWRQAVAYITGEANPHAQAALVRAACVNLRDAYDRLDRRVA